MSEFQLSKRHFKRKDELPSPNTHYDKTSKYTIMGFNPKQFSLIVLVIQNSLLVLMMRYSRTSKAVDQPIYIASTAVFMAEVIKIVSCIFMLYLEEKNFKKTAESIQSQVIQKPREIFKMLIPSGLYALQNNLLYIALSNLEAATFQVTYQLKILSTAIFSILVLGRTLNRNHWIALILLMVGVTLVQMENVGTSVTAGEQPVIGLLAVLTSCVSSGFAGCYFEKILKTSRTSMWIRNVQLAFCGFCFSFGAMVLSDGREVMTRGFFQGYDGLTWLVVLNQAMGGLLVALVVKYADNILKGFATSISIILSGLISYFLFDFNPSGLFMMGTAVVILATVLYGSKSK